MWRLIQGISRTTRGFWNASTRPAPRAVFKEDDEKENLVKNVSQTIITSPSSFIQEWNFKEQQIYKYEDKTEDKERRDWYRKNFYYNFWYQQCHQCNLCEALGLGTALLLGCQISQLWKLKVIKEKHSLRKDGCITYDLFKAAFGGCGNHGHNYILPCKGKHDNYNKKYETDVTWPKSPPQTENSDNSKQNITHRQRWFSPVENLDFVAFSKTQLHTDTCLQHPTTAENAEDPSKTEEADPIEADYTEEWDQLCRLCDAITYNLEGLKFAKAGNYTEALKVWEQAGVLGSSKAFFNLGLCYETGQGVTEDVMKASEYYQKASDQGSAVAAHNLALLYLARRCPQPHIDSGVELLKKAAYLGLAEAQTELGVICGEKGDMKSAVDLFRMAAEQNDMNSQYLLGLCYENGWGIKQNTCKAADLYSKASKAGHPQAMFNLAHFFEHGLGGIPVDHSEALKLCEKCAHKGHQTAKQCAKKLKHIDGLRHGNGALFDLPIKISRSAPAFSYYLRENLGEFSDLDQEGIMMTPTSPLIKSSTIDDFSSQEFINSRGYNPNHSSSSEINRQIDNKELSNDKTVKFVLGDCDEDSYHGDSNVSHGSDLNIVSDLFSLNGTFGEMESLYRPVPEIRSDHLSNVGIHESLSYDSLCNLSFESDDGENSDFSIVFDENFQDIRISRFPTAGDRNLAVNNESAATGSGITQGTTNRYSQFDIFSGGNFDELSNASRDSFMSNSELVAFN